MAGSPYRTEPGQGAGSEGGIPGIYGTVLCDFRHGKKFYRSCFEIFFRCLILINFVLKLHYHLYLQLMNKTFNAALGFVLTGVLGVLLLFTACSTQSDARKSTEDAGADRMIRTPTPTRPEGQEDMVGFAAPAIDTVRVGVIGLGMRGPGAVERMMHIPGAEVVALCDLHEDRVLKAQEIIRAAGRPDAALYFGNDTVWKSLCERHDIDLVYIVTDWETHAPMGVYAMQQGKHVAIEVPGAMTMDEIWALIDTSEQTRKHCMMLENCVYDFFELTTLNMIHEGVMGEILYAEGAYIHQLEDFWDAYEGDWRLDYNRKHRGDVYPTHGLGPACQALDIHRGDKMNYLVSMDSDPVSIPLWLKGKKGEEAPKIANGQHTVTLIRTEKGKTIEIQHDVASPRPYNRMYLVAGTKGFAQKYPVPGYAFVAGQVGGDITPNHEDLNAHSFVSAEVKDEMMKRYKHPILAEIEETAKRVGGHGGMDYIMDYRLIYCLRHGLPLDMDVYDLAEWSCLVPLTAVSLEHGSVPVEIPDFTRGAWDRIKGYRHAYAER